MARHLFELLSETASRVPGNTAYTGPEEQMDFHQLYQMSRAVASCVACRIPSRQPVAMLMDARSMLCVPVMMGVLAAGCFYAPLDPAMPEARLRLILDNLQPAMIIADVKHMNRLRTAFPAICVVCADDALQTFADQALIAERVSSIRPDDLSMVLYTSGSTGVPKGVAHTHQGMIAWTQNTICKYGFTQETVLANQSPFYYANSLLELFVPMWLGAKVVMIPPHYLTFPKKLIAYLQQQHVTELCMTPSSFVAVANSGTLAENVLPEMTMFIMSGEVMPKRQLMTWMQAAPNARAMNFYGSTEALSVAADDVVFPEHEGVIPVGRLFPDVQLRLMKDDGQEALPGEMGEMWVCSPTVAAGYYRDPERTNQVFLPDPVQRQTGVWFRTGDYGVLDSEGRLSVIGRKDSMIKHHGYRMELGEVEAAVRQLPGCLEACCLLHRETNEIWCFYTTNKTGIAPEKALKASLARYMLPDRYAQLDEMPHNANGKIDRSRLTEQMNAAYDIH